MNKFEIFFGILIFFSLQVISDAQANPTDQALYEFRAAAPAVFGMLGLCIVIGAIVFFGKHSGQPIIGEFKQERRLNVLKLVLYITLLLLTFSGMFFLYSYAWIEGFQLAFFSLFGIYSVWLLDPNHLLIYQFLSIFNAFCISGRLPFLGYGNNLAEQQHDLCIAYFSGRFDASPSTDTRCSNSGLLNWLRLLGLTSIVVQPIVVYFVYLLYQQITDHHQASKGGYQSFSTQVPKKDIPSTVSDNNNNHNNKDKDNEENVGSSGYQSL